MIAETPSYDIVFTISIASVVYNGTQHPAFDIVVMDVTADCTAANVILASHLVGSMQQQHLYGITEKIHQCTAMPMPIKNPVRRQVHTARVCLIIKSCEQRIDENVNSNRLFRATTRELLGVVQEESEQQQQQQEQEEEEKDGSGVDIERGVPPQQAQ